MSREHYRLQAYRDILICSKSTIIYYDVYCELYEAARIMADVVIRELHEGGGKCWGERSLYDCYGDIVNCFMNGHVYKYADCEFFIERLGKERP